jgi:hypothetical protein
MEGLTRQLAWSKKQTSYAWAKYYESERNALVDNIQHYHVVVKVVSEETVPEFIRAEMTEMMTQLRKQIECPICLQVIGVEELGIARCGHKYCKTCLGKLKETTKKCAVCRRKV